MHWWHSDHYPPQTLLSDLTPLQKPANISDVGICILEALPTDISGDEHRSLAVWGPGRSCAQEHCKFPSCSHPAVIVTVVVCKECSVLTLLAMSCVQAPPTTSIS
jgi:hypothetical protein